MRLTMVKPISICAGYVCVDCDRTERVMVEVPTVGFSSVAITTVGTDHGPVTLRTSKWVACAGCGSEVPYVVEGLELPGLMPELMGNLDDTLELEESVGASFYKPRVPGQAWDRAFWRRTVHELHDWGVLKGRPWPARQQ